MTSIASTLHDCQPDRPELLSVQILKESGQNLRRAALGMVGVYRTHILGERADYRFCRYKIALGICRMNVKELGAGTPV
jgi:hypothetical protein